MEEEEVEIERQFTVPATPLCLTPLDPQISGLRHFPWEAFPDPPGYLDAPPWAPSHHPWLAVCFSD